MSFNRWDIHRIYYLCATYKIIKLVLFMPKKKKNMTSRILYSIASRHYWVWKIKIQLIWNIIWYYTIPNYLTIDKN